MNLHTPCISLCQLRTGALGIPDVTNCIKSKPGTAYREILSTMAFGRSKRSTPSSPKPPKPPPNRESQGLNQQVHPYAVSAGAYSVNTFHPSVAYNQDLASMVHLPHPAHPPAYPYAGTASNGSSVWSPQPQKPSRWKSYTSLNQSMNHLVSHTVERTNATIVELEQLVHQSLSGGTNVNEATSRLLDQVITSIDLGSFCGKESELSEWKEFHLMMILY